MSTKSFFAAPSYGEREPSRPRAVNPETGKEQSWTRASNFAAELDNPFGLIKRNLRELVVGLARRPDLVRMIAAGVPLEDDAKGKIDEIIEAAHSAAATDAKANEGTAAHTALVRAWTHQNEPVAEEFVPLVSAFVNALRENGLTPVAAEQKVMNLLFDSIGSFDWIFEEADGTLVIGDVKTGRIDVAKRKFAVQCAMYQGGRYILHPDGSVEEMPWELAPTHAVLIHVDLEHGNAISVYRVNLHIGRHGATLAEQVRYWHKLDPLSPYVPPIVVGQRVHPDQPGSERVTPQQAAEHPDIYRPSGVPIPAVPADETQLIDRAVTSAGGAPFGPAAEAPSAASAGAAPSASPTDTTPSPQGAIGAVFSSAHQQTFGSEAALVQAHQHADRFKELMDGFDKAGLQKLLKDGFGWSDLSHNRRWLARCFMALQDGASPVEAKKFAAAKDDGDDASIVAESARADAGAVMQNPETAGPSHQTLLQAIAGANSEGAIDALRRDIVERRGDQAWTDELVAAARHRVAELSSSNGNAGEREHVLGQIQLCNSSEDLKNLWDRVTLGATCGELWTDEMQTAAVARLQAIQAAAPPPPSNPFG